MEIIIHRKGSIPAKDGHAMIPGSRGTHSYLVTGKDSQIHSLPHGAGRLMSRSEAKELLSSYSVKDMTKTDLDSYVVANNESLLRSEHPECYKNIDELMLLLENDYGVKLVGRFRPLVTVKY